MPVARSSKTLESVTKLIVVNGAALVQEEMKFGLADNEIAQMLIADMEYIPNIGIVPGNSSVALSLDPDSNLDPLTDDVEDLEYLGGMNVTGRDDQLLGTVGKTLVMDDKVNFGTNIGLTVKASAANRDGTFVITVWFLRKRASNIELAKILLKRR